MTVTAFGTLTDSSLARRKCRVCATPLQQTFIDLGMSPLCESFPAPADLNRGEMYYPLHVYVCEECFLVQLEEYESAEHIFSDYAYFSSFSDTWLQHCRRYCQDMADRFRRREPGRSGAGH